MSYIQVTINGQLRNLRYSNATNIEITQKMAGIKNTLIIGNIVLWAGLYIACIIDEQPIDFTFKDVCDWVDNEKISVDDMKKIDACYKESINFKVPDKKKVVKKKSVSKITKRGVRK